MSPIQISRFLPGLRWLRNNSVSSQNLQEYEYYDSILTIRYSSLINQIDQELEDQSKYPDPIDFKRTSTYKESIVASQKKWLIMREANEEIVRNYTGGTGAPAEINHQLIVDTKDRIDFLERL